MKRVGEEPEPKNRRLAACLLPPTSRSVRILILHLRIGIGQPVERGGFGRIYGDVRAADTAIGDIHPIGAQTGGQAVGLYLQTPTLAGWPREA